MITKNLYAKFLHSVRWNSIESIYYNSLLIGFQFVLYRITQPEQYGVIGILFSLLYIGTKLAPLGFNETLAPFFAQATLNKTTFRTLIVRQWYTHIALFAPLALICYSAQKLIPSILSTLQTLITLSPITIFLFVLLVFSESLKTTLRIVLQLTFLNQKTALIEMATITSYVVAFSYLFIVYGSVTLYTVFAPLLVTSLASAAALSLYVYYWYQELPDTSHKNVDFTTQKRFTVLRGFNIINQISRLCFSGNMLIPLFAWQFGIASAGVFKLANMIGYSISRMIRKMFDSPSLALLSKTKTMDSTAKQFSFGIITNNINRLVVCVMLFLLVNHKALLYGHGFGEGTLSWWILCFFLILPITENLFIAYETFYLVEEKPWYIFFTNISTIALFYGIATNITLLNPMIIVLLLTSYRLALLIGMSTFSFYRWNIKPNWRVQPAYLFSSLLIAFAFFFLYQ